MNFIKLLFNDFNLYVVPKKPSSVNLPALPEICAISSWDKYLRFFPSNLSKLMKKIFFIFKFKLIQWHQFATI